MNRFFRNLSALALVCAALTLWSGGVAKGQTFRGTILGTVTDSSGGAITGATVTIKNVDTGLTRTVTTSEDGSYSAPELPIGNYTVDVKLFADGNLIAHTDSAFEIVKVGFEQFIANSSKQHGLLYGLATALMALMTGWLASVVFRRD